MGRPKGALNKRTLRRLKDFTGNDHQPEQSQELRDQISVLQRSVEALTKKIEDRSDPTLQEKAHKKFNSEELVKQDFLSDEQTQVLEVERQKIQDELEGKRVHLGSMFAGDVTIEQRTTGNAQDLYQRLGRVNKTLALQERPDLTDLERNKLTREYDVLRDELRKIFPSQKAQWDTKHDDYADAVHRIQELSKPRWASKIRRWQNIGRILDPSNPSMWDTSQLSKL